MNRPRAATRFDFGRTLSAVLHAGALLTAWLLAPQAALAQNAEIVRGRVTSTDERPIAGAEVTVTGDATQSIRKARTDSSGRYTVAFIDAEGSYTILVQRIGFAPALSRARHAGQSNTLNADVVLAPAIFTLPAITAESRNSAGRPGRPEAASIGGMADDRPWLLTQYLLDPGDLEKFASRSLGVQSTSDSTYSVMGASDTQNGTVLDGMKFEGGNLPPDAICGQTLSTTTSDPSRGRFAGGQVAIASCSGHDRFESAARGWFTGTTLSWQQAGSPIRATNIGDANGYIAGPLHTGIAHYHLAFDLSARSTSAQSLSHDDDLFLGKAGVGSDSVALVASALNALGVPLTAVSIPSSATTLRGSTFLRADWNIGSTSSLLFTFAGAASHSAGGFNPLSFPSIASSNSARNFSAMLRGSTFALGGLDELSLQVGRSNSESAPYQVNAAGTVLVGTADGSLASLGFGGSSYLASSRAHSVDLRNEFSKVAGSSGHRLKIGVEWITARSSDLRASDSLGTFAYQSISDLARNAPSQYDRTVGAREEQISLGSVAAWIGDIWPVNKALAFEGGIRADAQWAAAPAFNATLDSAFGIRTDRIPGDVGISPRFGFARLLHKHPLRTRRDPITGRVFTMRELTDADLAGAVRGNVDDGITLFGGVGAFHGTLPRAQVASLQAGTGIGGLEYLSCVGDAVPTPNWSSIRVKTFDQCRDIPGSPIGGHPDVVALDPSFRAPTDWKASLGLSGLYVGRWTATLSAVVRDEIHSASQLDVNLQRSAAFALTGENGRPVLVPAASIVPSSGLIAAGAGRPLGSYGSVMTSLSDLHARALQLNAQLATPSFFGGHVHPYISYSYNVSSREARGFDATTAGDPYRVEQLHGSQPLHEFRLDLFDVRVGWFSIGVQGDLRSGTAYTPLVAGDINGDGYANDRAFIPEVGAVTDSTTHAQLATLLSNAPPSARRCILAQQGSIAQANSCRGPWQSRLDLALELVPSHSGFLGNRVTASVTMLNAGALLLRGLGVGAASIQGAPPLDNRLLFVTGFDPAAQRFLYRVNGDFGQPIGAGVRGSALPPFQLKLLVSYSMSASPSTAAVRKLMSPGARTDRPTSAQILSALRQYSRNPADTILALRDSLSLSAQQVSRLNVLSHSFRSSVDSLAAPFVASLLAMGRRLTDDDLFSAMVRFLAAVAPPRNAVKNDALAVLDAAQRQKLESLVTSDRLPHSLP